jgi:hypothetical protein
MSLRSDQTRNMRSQAVQAEWMQGEGFEPSKDGSAPPTSRKAGPTRDWREEMYESRRAIPGLDPAVGAWISGFVAGEGCFHITRTSNTGGGFNCGFTIKLRSDDRLVLERVQEIFGGRGSITTLPRESSTRHPQAVYRIGAKRDCLFLVDVFDEYPLWPAKKARDFEVWRKAVIFLQGVGGGKTDWTEMDGYFHAIRAAREFSMGANPFPGRNGSHNAGAAP